MNRSSGFYWVLLQCATQWQVAEYNKPNELWRIIGYVAEYPDDYFEKINEQRILPPKN